MKWRTVLAWIIPVLCLVVFLFFSDNQVSGQDTTELTPEAQQDPKAVTDQAPQLPREQPAAIPQFSLTVGKTGNGQGRVTSNPAGNSFKKGTPVTLHAVPDANSLFTGWSGSCSKSSPTCTITMAADSAVTASFSLKTYTIRVPTPWNGVIHPSGMIKVSHGEKRRFQIIPLPGYRVSEVLVDKASVGSVNSYTFNNVADDHLLEVIFVKQ